MKELYIDFDGVILDTISVLYKDMEDNGIDINDKEYYKNIDFGKYLKDEYIINDGINAVQKLIDSGKFIVSILTHISSLDEGVKKVHYLRRFFKDITIILVPKEISKTKMIHTEGAILVDDYTGNLRDWEQEKGIGVRFNRDLNGKGFKVIDNLNQLLEMF